jgi:hypothetical protein
MVWQRLELSRSASTTFWRPQANPSVSSIDARRSHRPQGRFKANSIAYNSHKSTFRERFVNACNFERTDDPLSRLSSSEMASELTAGPCRLFAVTRLAGPPRRHPIRCKVLPFAQFRRKRDAVCFLGWTVDDADPTGYFKVSREMGLSANRRQRLMAPAEGRRKPSLSGIITSVPR